MKQIPLNAEMEPVVRRVVWFESPEQALADPVRFIAYALHSLCDGERHA